TTRQATTPTEPPLLSPTSENPSITSGKTTASKVKRLIADVSHGLEQTTEFEDSICFLGTVIALRDLQYTTVEPIDRPMVPPKVMTIIDGQQRLTTLLLLTTVLHEEISVRAKRLPKNGGDARDWCYNQAIDVTSRLTDTFEEDMRYGEGDYRYYPRMVRSYHDVWSRHKDRAKYDSPIGYYLHQYGRYARDEASTKDYKHVPFANGEVADANAQAHRGLEAIRTFVRRTLRNAVSASRGTREEETEILSARAIGESSRLQEALFNSPFPETVVEAAKDDDRIGSLLRLIVFANYLLNRVTVAVVTAKREDYGFDMFEALNTTGQPLTAIETFKPKAIQNEGLSSWNGSESYTYFDTVEKYLDRSSSADQRQTATSNILIPFALMHDGARLSKRLSEQRRYLRTAFDKEADQAGRRTFLHSLAEVTRFVSGPWAGSGSLPEYNDDELRRQAELCLQVLREAKHDIVIAPLTRYYAAHRLSTEEHIDKQAREYLTAVRACGAFFALWRGAFGGTHGIDNIYRKLMQYDPKTSAARFTRYGQQLTIVPPVEDMLGFLRAQLQSEGLAERSQWVTKAAATPAYTSSRHLTKLLLLAASNDSAPDETQRGLVIRGRSGLLSALNLDQWNGAAAATIEHIAPQSSGNNGWDSKIYEDSTTVHTLGNLTLLPKVENSSASDRSWELKRLMFRTLSASTVEEAEKTLSLAAQEGISLGEGAEAIIRRSRHLPLVSSLAQREEEWTEEFIRERSERLCGLAWESLAPWLGL
ncbi:HNH endonuclease family protein, partial [Streptomyces sp. NPDC006186]|uniref:HNH endonuclease family protein n=1 Tax=Streptomyces sp. NPDC006186 TaxID=3155248 RepID=UPI0033B0A273